MTVEETSKENRRRDAIAAAASFYTPTLPLLKHDQPLLLSSGYLPARPSRPGETTPADDAHLYFVIERARHLTKKRRLIIWFNGGPGCSSFDGLLMEVGAFRPDLKGGLEWTKDGGAWNEYADVLYLDQPVGTGFSYVNTNGYVHTLEQAADEVVYFLERLIEVYPEYAKDNGAEVYLTGESYAGQYLPFTAAAILKKGKSAPVDLSGIAIGNGYIDPKAQSGSELEMMVKANIWKEGDDNYKTTKAEVDKCMAILANQKDNLRKVPGCDFILPNIIGRTKTIVENREMCINIYDVRLSDTAPACGMNWPPTLQATYDYLARDDVRKALHVDTIHKPEAWVECNRRVGAGLDGDRQGKAAVVHLPYILESNVKVLLFAGDQDLICNSIGVERVAEQLQWGGRGWGAPEKKQWFVNEQDAGYWRSNRNLTFVSIAQASHMVGVDKPIEGHDMILRFMGVDLLEAAGPSAMIPSRIQGEADRKLVITGGSSNEKDSRPMIPGKSGKTEAEVAEEAKWAAYYNAGSAALIVLLILVGTGVCILLRLRRQAKLRRHGSGPSLPVDEEDAGQHEMDRFIPDDDDATPIGDEGGYSDDTSTYRLDATTASNTIANRNVPPPSKGAANGNYFSGVAHDNAEEIFDVGNESDEEDHNNQPRRGNGNEAVRFA